MTKNPPSTPPKAKPPGARNGMFHLFHIHIVLKGLEVDNVAEFAKIITSNGGTFHKAATTSDNIPPETTHIVSSLYSKELQQSDTVAGEMIPVVKPTWVLDSAKIGVHLPDRPYSPNPENIFSDVLVVIAGLPAGDKAALKAGVNAMGGQATNELTKMVTHVIAYDTNGRECRIAKIHGIKIVIPQWIDDCLKLNRRLDEAPYLLDTVSGAKQDVPASQAEPCKTIVSSRKSGPFDFTFPPSSRYVPNFFPRLMGGNLEGAQIDKSETLENSTQLIISSLEPKSQLFQNHAFYIGSDLCLSTRMEATIMQIIIDCGGQVTTSFTTEPKPTVYIGRYRDGDEYVWASRSHMLVGNLVWLYYMVSNKMWTSPLDKLLHYPVPREGIPTLKDVKMSITNYYGDGRAYVIELIETLGADYTREFSPNNSFLVAGAPEGSKFDAARSWNVHVVNHLWLEECFAKWQEMSMSLPQYTHFPRHTVGISEVLGQRKLDEQTLKRFYMTNKEIQEELDGEAQPSSPLVSATASTPAKRLSESDEDPTPKKQKTLQETTPMRSRRAAAFSAAQKLHKNMEDLNVFQKQLQNKRQNIPLLPEEIDKRRAEREKAMKESEEKDKNKKAASVEKKPEEEENQEEQDAQDDDAQDDHSEDEDESLETEAQVITSVRKDTKKETKKETKVAKKETKKEPKKTKAASRVKEESPAARSASPAPPKATMQVVVTGIASDMKPDARTVGKLGIKYTEDVSLATHIISDSVKRTEKFLRAMARDVTFVSEKYLKECVTQGCQVPVDNWLLDCDGFSEAVSRAAVLKGRLFSGLQLNYANQPGMNAIMSIAKDHQASINPIELKLGRGKKNNFVVTETYEAVVDGVDRGEAPEKPPFVIFICVPGKDEAKWKALFQSHLEEHKAQGLFLSKDWVTHSIIQQELLFGEFSL